MATATALFRTYDLPWTASDEEQGRLRRLLAICFGVTVVLSILLPLLPLPPRSVDTVEPVPPRLAKLVLEREVKPPEPPPPPPKIDPVKPTETRPTPAPKPTPQPVDRAQEARRKAVQAAVAFDQLAALRDNSLLEKASQKNLTTSVGEQTRSERSLLTSKVGTSSGGINTANLSRGYGGSTGALAGHSTTQVNSAVLDGQANNVKRAAGSGKASRSEEEIALVFDRNKGAIYALYTRALRDKPDLQGKVVLELTIGADGSIQRCNVISSELNDPELERKLVARVKSFRFEAKDVGTITVTKPIDFFPA